MSSSILSSDPPPESGLGSSSEPGCGGTVELLLAGGSIWASDPANLRAELTRRGLKYSATENEHGSARGGTMIRLEL